MVLVLSLLIISLGIVLLCAASNGKESIFWFAMLCVVGGVLLGISLEKTKYENVPTSIDVYRGKTTLKITYQDSIPIDSVVVFKNR